MTTCKREHQYESDGKGCPACKRERYNTWRNSPEGRAKQQQYGRTSAARRRERNRLAVFEAYGGECACCGETEPTFLSIDHINGGGNKHRAAVTKGKGGTAFYAWLVKSGFPKGFRVLCHNCNHSIHVLGGRCAHGSS